MLGTITYWHDIMNITPRYGYVCSSAVYANIIIGDATEMLPAARQTARHSENEACHGL